MSASRPGTVRGDQAVYAGRVCIGFIRGTAGGAIAFDADGNKVGSFPSRRAAAAALSKSGEGQ